MAEENNISAEEITDETVMEDTDVNGSEVIEEDVVNDADDTAADEAVDNAKEDSMEDSDTDDGKAKKAKKEKKEKKDPKDVLIEELSDKYKRTMAEFDNFRKRTEKEKSAMYEIGAKSIIEKILPVADSFERGLASIPEEDRNNPLAEGMDKIYRQFTKMLEEAGVREIDAVGEEFNPDMHNAVMHIEDEAFGENVVAEVLQKGYTYRDMVVRHSMVKVAN